MRFARYEHRGALRTGAIDEDDRLHPVDGDPTLRALLEYDALESAGAAALARIFAFILICLGVAIFWQGFSELWLELSAQATAAAAAVK